MLRLLANLTIFSSLIFFPWWVTLAVAVVAVFLIPSFYEAMVWAIIGDTLYGTKSALFFNVPFVFTLCALGILLLSDRVKKMTRFY